MKKKLLSALLACSLVGALMVGCGSTSSDSEKKEEAKTEEESKEESDEVKITEGRKIVIATAGTAEPYSLISDDGKWTGIDAEIWDEICKRTGWTYELKQAAFDAIWGELDTQRADVCANCWAVKEERTDKYNATIPYYGDAQCIIVADDNKDLYTLEDLKGKTVGITNGQAAQTIMEENAKKYDFELKLYEDTAVGMKDLSLGRIDAYANTTSNVLNYEHYNEGEKFRFFEEDLMANNVAYFLPKTEDGEQLTKEINVVLQEMLDDGTIGKITEKWMFKDMTELIQK
ncbi:MAG: transporter substrate-binding domain-containing protein [Lachnospiraceae bacterium]|nr:transporter substrate-binding domain-containing protein [Lachnospiraceae bacterium]